MAATIYAQEVGWETVQAEFVALKEYVVSAAGQTQLHEAEEGVYRRLLQLGRALLERYAAASGTGHTPGAPPTTAGGQPLAYKGLQTVEYLSIFGAVALTRAAYACPEGGYVYPLDQQWNRPERKYSYLLQQWLQAAASESDYREAAARLHEVFGFPLVANVPQRLTQAVGATVDGYYAPAAAPAAGSHLAVTADGKGVRLQRPRAASDDPHPRRGKGEKRGLKKEAIVTVDYSFDPVPRTPEEMVELCMRGRTAAACQQRCDQRQQRRQEGLPEPRAPQQPHVRGTLAGKEAAFERLADRIQRRDPEGRQRIVALLDGATALETQLRARLKAHGLLCRVDAFIVDLWHVSEYLWEAGTALFGETHPERNRWVEDQLRALLHGRVGRVIGGLRQRLTKSRLRATQRRTLDKVITYFHNHRHMMAYHTYLARGYPIATGVVEGACNSLVNDRMEQSGMRWSVPGAEAMLQQRAVKKNGDWEDFWAYYMATERRRLYPQTVKAAA
jgi:hypothetical protein